MVELAILSGRRAHSVISVPRLPCSIGREGADVAIAEPGVASLHATLKDAGMDGMVLESTSSNSIYVDGRVLQRLAMRDGTVFELGSIRVQFRIRPARPLNLRWLENLTFGLVAATIALEIAWLAISSRWP